MSCTPVLSVTELDAYYGHRRVLTRVSLSILPGEIVCLMGPNGAGKSTLLLAITSALPPAHGTVEICGARPESHFRRNLFAQIGYLGHEPGLYYDLAPAENLRAFAGMMSAKIPEDRIANLLARSGIPSHRLTEPVRNYSRGMRQRVGLVRALCHNPAVLLLDEPLNGLDPQGEGVLLELLKEHRAARGSAVIVTHSDEPFLGTATRFVFLREGEIAADLPAEKYTEKAKARVREILYG